MVFNGDANGQDLVTLMNDYLNVNNTVFTLAEKARKANIASNKIWSEIFDVYSGWQYDDSNQSGLPEDATQSLTTGVSDYTIPTGALTVIGVDIRCNGVSNNLWAKVYPATKEEIRQYGLSDTAFSVNNGTPFRYIMLKDKIRLIPAPNYTQTNSLRISYDRGSVAFLPTDTTKTPGFASEFHYGVALGAALEWARTSANSDTTQLEADWALFKKNIRSYYATRFKDNYPTTISFDDATMEYI